MVVVMDGPNKSKTCGRKRSFYTQNPQQNPPRDDVNDKWPES